MKTLKFLASRAMMSVTTLVVVLSCAKEPVENLKPSSPEKETVTLHLSAPATKTSLQDDKTVLWSEGDKVVINHTLYAVTVDPENPAVAIVEGVEKANEYYAVYVKGSESGTEENFGPQYDFYADGGVNWYSVYLYPYQHYFTDTFAPFTNPMVGYSTDTDIKFYNLGSVVKVGLTGNGEAISRVILKANGGRTISGLLKLSEEQIRTKNYSGAVFDAKYNNLMRSFVWLTCDAQQTVVLSSTPTWFYFVTAPFTDEAGISIVVEDTEGNVFTRTKTDAFSIDRSEIKEMDPLDYKASEPLKLTAAESAPTSFSVDAVCDDAMSVRYLAIASAAWDSYMNSNPWTEQSLASVFINNHECQTNSGKSFRMEFTKAYNSTGNAVPIAASTSYKVIAQYIFGNTGVGKCTIINVTTAAPTGVAPTLDVSFQSVTYNQLQALLKSSDAAGISLWLFTKARYEELVSSGKSDSEIMKEYGKPLDTEQIAQANTEGCEWNWWDLSPLTDYVILVIATSSTGMETIVRKDVTTDYYIFNPKTTVLEIVSESGVVETNLFQVFNEISPALADMTFSNLTIKKVPGMDVFVIENLFKGNAELQNVSFVDKQGDYMTIIDARDASAVDILYEMNDMGIYNTAYNGFASPLRFGCYATLNTSVSKDDFPLGIYDKARGKIEFNSLVLGDRVAGLYGPSAFVLTISANNSALSIEDFAKKHGNW